MHRAALTVDALIEMTDNEDELEVDMFVHRCHDQRLFRIENTLRDFGYRIVRDRSGLDGDKIIKGYANDGRYSRVVRVFEMR